METNYKIDQGLFKTSQNQPEIIENEEKQELNAMVKSPFKCEICSLSFKRKLSLKHHIKRAHEENKHFQCDVCHLKFKEKGQLNQHKFIHEGKRSFKCNICFTRFTQ